MKWRLEWNKAPSLSVALTDLFAFTQRDFSSGKTTVWDWRDVRGHVECRHSDGLILQDVAGEDLPVQAHLASTTMTIYVQDPATHTIPTGSWCPDAVFLAVPLPCLQVFPAQNSVSQ